MAPRHLAASSAYKGHSIRPEAMYSRYPGARVRSPSPPSSQAFALPPDLILHALTFPVPWDPQTIPTLLSIQLVNSTLSTLSKSAEIWAPLLHFEYERTSSSLDRAPTPYGEFVRRRTVNTHVSSGSGIRKLVEATHWWLPLLSAVAELGPDALEALQEIAEEGVYETDGADWIARGYWAEECIGVIRRRDAFETWRSMVWGGMDQAQRSRKGRRTKSGTRRVGGCWIRSWRCRLALRSMPSGRPISST